MTNQLQQAIALIKAGHKGEGRQLLVELLKSEPKHEQAWLWLASVADTADQRRHCLKRVLAINPDNTHAQQGLAKLPQPRSTTRIPSEPPKPPPSPLQTIPAKQENSVDRLEGVIPPLPPSPVASPPARADESEETLVWPSPAATPVPPPRQVPANVDKPEESLSWPTPAPASSPSPSLKRDAPVESLRPPIPAATPEPELAGSSPKNIWLNPEALLDRVIILHGEAVIVANPSRETLKQLQPALERGMLPEQLLDRKPKVAPLKAIKSVRTNQLRKDLTINYQGKEKTDSLGITFASQAARDEFFAALEARLSPGFVSQVQPFNMFQAMLGPLLIFGVIFLATYLCHGAAVEAAAGIEPEIRGRRQLLKLVSAWGITLLGPTGILIVGGILAVLILYWMFTRMMTPPIMMTLTPATGPKPPSSPRPEPGDTPSAPAKSSLSTPTPKPIQEAGPKQAPPAKPAPRSQPVKPKEPVSGAKIVRLSLIFLVTLALSLAGLVGFWYWTLPPTFPGLIEGGMALDLSGRNLTSADLAALSLDQVPQENLVIVDFSRNPITTLPPEIGQLRNIQALYIKNTQLTTLPPEIGQLSNLDLLILNDNQLTSVPPEIGQLTKLEHLDLQGNQLKTLPPEIGRLPNLKVLNIQRNFNIQLPPDIEQRPGLLIYR